MNIKEKIIDIFYPNNISCFLCGNDLSKRTKTFICDDCKAQIPFIKNPCKKCGRDVPFYDSCRYCAGHKYYFDRAISVVRYDEIVKNCMYNLKKNSHRYLSRFMAYYMACAVLNNKIKVDAIMCVPASKHTIKSRGFNQAQDLMRFVNDKLKLEDLSSHIIQIKETSAQKSLDYKERQKIVADKYKIVKPSKLKGKSVLLVDDVLTTGATASKIAQLLKYSGVNKVFVITFASVTLKDDNVDSFLQL